MRKIIVFASVLFLTNTFVHAQKKKDLLEEIDKLRKEIQTTQADLSSARKNQKISEGKVKSMETQVRDLEETNTSLLNKMSTFTQLSNQKADNLKTSQEIIKQKDLQLNTINDAITKGDSTQLSIYSAFKNAIGGDQLKIGKGNVYIILPNTTLFGQNDRSYKVDAKAKPTLEKIAAVINANPDIKIIVEGNSNALKFDGKLIADNWDLSARQAASIVRMLQNDFKVDPKRMEVLGKSEYGSEAIETVTRIIVDPKFDKFYALVKDNMKNDKK